MTERIKWYRTELDKTELKALQQRNDLCGLIQVGGQLFTVGLTGLFCFYSYHHFPIWVTLAAFSIHGSFFSFLSQAAAIHELSHGTPFKTKALNEFFLGLFGFLTWNNPVWFRVSHARHHQNPVHDVLDQEVVLPQIFDWKIFVQTMLFSPTGFVRLVVDMTRKASGQLTTDWAHSLFDDKPKKHKQMIGWARFILLGHIAMVAIFLYIGQWILIPIVAIPLYSNFASFLCSGTQHSGLQGNVPDFRRSCRTILINPFARFWYWNMNYHIEHHMYAAVPFHALPRLHKLMKHDCPEPCRGFVQAWKEIFAIGKRQKADPSYYYDNFSRNK